MKRDKRLTTHVGLTARAFGATGFIYSGDIDYGLEKSLFQVTQEWGGNFEVHYWDDWVTNCQLLRSADTVILHLTMYGEPIQSIQTKIQNLYYKKKKNILIAVGGARVPPEIYQMSYNIAVTNQPHSEVAALAVSLDRFFPSAIGTEFPTGKLKIDPNASKKLIPKKD